MRQISKARFWLKVSVFFVFNFLLCFLLGILLSSKGMSGYFNGLRQKDFINYFIISFLFAFALNLWLFHDPASKTDRSRKRRAPH